MLCQRTRGAGRQHNRERIDSEVMHVTAVRHGDAITQLLAEFHWELENSCCLEALATAVAGLGED